MKKKMPLNNFHSVKKSKIFIESVTRGLTDSVLGNTYTSNKAKELIDGSRIKYSLSVLSNKNQSKKY